MKFEETLASALAVVSSLSSWAKSEEGKKADLIRNSAKRGSFPKELNVDEADSELACSILQLGFLGKLLQMLIIMQIK